MLRSELFKITTVCFPQRYTVEKVSNLYYVSDSYTHLSVGVWCITATNRLYFS